MTSSPLEPEAYDCVAIVTNHSAIDYGDVVERGKRDRRLPQRDQGPRDRRQGLEACDRGSASSASTTGARTSPATSTSSPTLAWLCDLDDGSCATRRRRAIRTRTATAAFDDLLADDTLDAVVIATPVPTHYALAKQALEAGKHVFVEKPPAMRAAEMDELVELAADARPRADARATSCSTTPAC